MNTLMIFRAFLQIFFYLACFLVTGCRTDVSTGRNGDPKRQHQPDPETVEPTAEQLDALGDRSCFGTGSADENFFEQYCTTLAEHQGYQFEHFEDLLCTRKKLYNLLLPECGWGLDSRQKPQDFVMPIEHTPLNDQTSTDFYFLSASSLTLPPSQKSLKDLLFRAYTNTDQFRKDGFIFPLSTTVVPDKNGTKREADTDILVYQMIIKGTVTNIRFNAELRSYQLDSGFEVITERSIVGIEGINWRKSLHLSLTLPNGQRKIVILEETDVPDRGMHDIARIQLFNHSINRMRLFYDNYAISE